jgi:hypothetical protein
MSSNFNNSTPAAPAGFVNVSWQTDGSGNDSAYVPTSATNMTASNVDLTAQTANVTTTTLFTPTASGLFRISAYIVVTTVDGASSTLPSVIISWEDQNNTTSQSLVLTPTNSGNLLTTYQEATGVISAETAVAVTYATSGYASGTPATMQFALHLRIESLT